MVLNFLRFRQRPPGKTPPPNNRVDVFHDAEAGKLVARDSQGNPVLFDSAGGGAASTADLITSNGTSNAAAGKLGEYLENGPPASPIPLSTGSSVNIASIALTAGDWDISGSFVFVFAGATVESSQVGISTTPNSFDPLAVGFLDFSPYVALSAFRGSALPARRVLLNSPATIYLVVEAGFSAGTVSVTAKITARRVR